MANMGARLLGSSSARPTWERGRPEVTSSKPKVTSSKPEVTSWKTESEHRPRDMIKTALLTVLYKIHPSFIVLGSMEDLTESPRCKESRRSIQQETKIW